VKKLCPRIAVVCEAELRSLKGGKLNNPWSENFWKSTSSCIRSNENDGAGQSVTYLCTYCTYLWHSVIRTSTAWDQILIIEGHQDIQICLLTDCIGYKFLGWFKTTMGWSGCICRNEIKFVTVFIRGLYLFKVLARAIQRVACPQDGSTLHLTWVYDGTRGFWDVLSDWLVNISALSFLVLRRLDTQQRTLQTAVGTSGPSQFTDILRRGRTGW